MATKDLWINLPVKNVNRSKTFFTQMGFAINTKYVDNDNSACILIGQKNIVVMLFDEPTFKTFIQHDISDADISSEVLISIDAESKEEVDEMARKAVAAGGKSNHVPSEMKGWLYGCLFTDPDGHRWNVLYMDLSKMPKN